ncbi:hypothetical protein D3C86_1553070 [compost metagenome]
MLTQLCRQLRLLLYLVLLFRLQRHQLLNRAFFFLLHLRTGLLTGRVRLCQLLFQLRKFLLQLLLRHLRLGA